MTLGEWLLKQTLPNYFLMPNIHLDLFLPTMPFYFSLHLSDFLISYVRISLLSIQAPSPGTFHSYFILPFTYVFKHNVHSRTKSRFHKPEQSNAILFTLLDL